MEEEKIFTITVEGTGYLIKDQITKKQLGAILSIVTSNTDFSSVSSKTDGSTIKVNKKTTKKREKTSSNSPVLVRSEIENLALDPISDTYGNYWTISKIKSDRFMWILAVLNEKGFQDVNHKEISAIAGRFGDNIPAKFITSFLISHKKNGRAIPSSMGTVRTVRILKPGLDYVRELSKKEA